MGCSNSLIYALCQVSIIGFSSVSPPKMFIKSPAGVLCVRAAIGIRGHNLTPVGHFNFSGALLNVNCCIGATVCVEPME